MSATYTTSLRLTLQGDGDNPNTWGDVENEQVIELIEAGVCGVAQVNCTGSSDVNIAITTQNGAPDTARNMVLQLVGTIGADIQLIVPAVAKMYLVDALWTGDYTVTVIPVGGSSGVELETGQKVVLYTSGSTITKVSESTAVGALLAANNLSDLTDVAAALTNLGLGTMATQNANNVNITGGTISGVTGLSAVTSVAGRTGAVVLSNTDISGLGALALLNSVSGSTGGTTVNSGSTGSLVMGAVTLQWGLIAVSGGTTQTINFGTAFSGTPYNVTLTAQTTSSWTTWTPPAVTSTTSTTFTATGLHSYGFYWLAIGPT